MKNVCISGATGYIGQHLVQELLQRGQAVHIIARRGSDLTSIPTHPLVKIHSDVVDASDIASRLRNMEITSCFHLASFFTARHTPHQIPDLINSNLKFATELLQAVVDSGCTEFINTGTVWQHYQQADYKPVCLYAATKKAFEDILAYYVDAYNIKAANLKLCDTYGPRDKRRKILTLLIEAVRLDKEISLSPGYQKLDLVHIRDVCAAFLSVQKFLSDKPNGRIFDFQISSLKPYTLREIVDMIQEISRKEMKVIWGAHPYRPRENMEPWMNSDLPPGWSAKVDLTEGLKELYEKIALV